MVQLFIALIIFIGAYVVIISERLHQTVAALFAGTLMIILGVIHQEQAIEAIDFNTLGLLIGMMILVEIIKSTGIFQYIAVKSAKMAHGQPLRVLVYLSLITAVASAFLDNVTTILIVLPLTFIIADTLDINPEPFLVTEILLANIGGAATLIGDPPNILIGSAAKLSFNQFLVNLAPVIIVIMVVIIALMTFIYRKELKVTPEIEKKVMAFSPRKLLENTRMVKRSLFVLLITMIGFIFHQQLNLEAATIALSGAGLLLIFTNEHPAKILKDVEWTTIFFIIGIFVLVAGIEQVGVLQYASQALVDLAKGNIYLLAIIIIWVAGLGSSFLNSIPFVLTMIPVVEHIGLSTGLAITPLWWALALGACLGGNGTMFGAPANVAAIGIYKNSGKRFGWFAFFKFGFPVMLISLVIATIYVIIFLI